MAKALLDILDFPLAAPSANPFGYISPTTAQHVADQLGNKVYYILDGGTCDVGLESTIIKVNEGEVIEVLRKGGLTIEALQNVAKNIVVNELSTSNPEAPGMLLSHYAPRMPLVISDLGVAQLEKNIHRVGVIAFKQFIPNIPIKHQIVLSPSGNYCDAARNLFAGMRYLDGCDIDIIYAELLPEEDLGIAINDRLRRASQK
jgi:L-threonylcarbamoyladenylate synthase